MELVDVISQAGIYLGKATALRIEGEDWNRSCNVLTKYIKGLFFYTFSRTAPSKYGLKHFMGNDNLLDQLRYVNKWNWDNREVFAYGYNFVPNTYESVWATVFYDSRFFLSCMAPAEILKQLDGEKRTNKGNP